LYHDEEHDRRCRAVLPVPDVDDGSAVCDEHRLPRLEICPGAVPIASNPERCSDFRRDIEAVLADYDADCSISGLSSAFLDITAIDRDPGEVAREVHDRLGCLADFPLRIGIGPSKVLARIASARGDAISLAPASRSEIIEFMKDAPIESLPGLSPADLMGLRALRVATLRDVIEQRAFVMFGMGEKFSQWLFAGVLGVDRYLTGKSVGLRA
jgi:DNA polymerase-4